MARLGEELTLNPPLPARYEIKGGFELSQRLQVYHVFDRQRGHPARLWLEKGEGPPVARRERANKLGKLDYPNLLSVCEHWPLPGTDYYAVVTDLPADEYVSLRDLLNEPLPLPVAGQIVRQVGLALAYCHSQGVLHLHLLPEFIWVGSQGKVKLELFAASLPQVTEFEPFRPRPNLTARLRATVYQGPEVSLQPPQVDERSDLYMLGLLAYQLLAGYNPFQAPDDSTTRLLHATRQPPALGILNPDVNPILEGAVMQALAKKPEDRFPTVLNFIARFDLGVLNGAQGHHEGVAAVQKLVEARLKTRSDGPVPPPVMALPLLDASAGSGIAADSGPITGSIPAVSPLSPANVPARPPAPPVTRRSFLRWSAVAPWLLVLNLLAFMTFIWVLANTSSPTADLPAPTAPVAPASNPSPAASQPAPPRTPVALPPEGINRGSWDTLLNITNLQVLEQGKLEESIQVYRSIVERDAGFAPAYRDLGRTLLLRGQSGGQSSAVEALQKATNLDAGDALAWAYLALAYLDEYRYDEAQKAVGEALRLNPKLADAQAANTLLLLRLNPTTNQAAQAAAEATRLDPQNFWGQWASTAVALQNKDWPGAGAGLDSLLAKYPRLAWLHSSKGDLLRLSGSPEAAGSYEQALKLDGSFPYAHSGLGLLYYSQNEILKAEAAYNKALAVKPNHAASLTGLGYVRLSERNFAQSQEAFEKAIKADPRQAEAYNGLAATYLNRGEPRQVITWADRALQYAPGYTDAYYNKGRALYELKDYSQAASAFEAATRLDPKNPLYYEALAYAHFGAGDKTAALQAARQGLQLKPATPSLQDLVKQLGE